MKLLTVIAVLGFSLGTFAFPTPLENVPLQCADPTFACQDIESARLCGVVKSCVHDIWATMNAPDDNDEVCDICKEMVKEARDQLLSNMTQEEIKEVFEGSCKLLPVKLIADGCIKIVDEIIPELVEMLASRMDPNMVCTVSGMCNMAHFPMGNSIAKALRDVLSKRTESKCDQCITLVVDVQTFLNSTSQSDVETYLKKFCDGHAPKYLCDILVNEYFPSAYKYIVQTGPTDLCSSVGICPGSLHCNVPVGDELTCEFCDHVLKHVQEMIVANTTKEEFHTALLNFCKHMGSFSDKCTSIVNDYYDMIFDYIGKMDTRGLCTLIGLCDNAKCQTMPMVKIVPAVEMRKTVPLVKLTKGFSSNILGLRPRIIPATSLTKAQMVEESNDIFDSRVVPLLPVERFGLPHLEEDNQCAFCRAITFFLKEDLKGDTSKEGVKKALEHVCERWVVEFPDICSQFVDKYSVKLQHLITKNMPIDTLCPLMKLCQESEVIEPPARVVSKDDLACTLCKDVMTEVENALNDPAITKKVEDLLDQSCCIVPPSMTDDCKNFINKNVETLIDLLKQEMTPNNICPALHLCPAELRVSVPKPVKDLECDVCKDVVSSLKQQLQDPTAQTVVQTFLEEGCEQLPGSLAQECKKYVDDNIKTIMSMLIKEMDPDSVCSLFNICPGSHVSIAKSPFTDVECDLCKQVVQKVYDLVKDKQTEEEIENALKKVCDYLPSSMSAKCRNFVTEYTDILITLITQEADPNMICQLLNMCPTSLHYPAWQFKAQGLECEGCQYALHFLQNELMDGKAQEHVKQLMKKMCGLLPKTYGQNCEAFMDEYGSAFLALLAQEIDPSFLCYRMNMCSNQTKLYHQLQHAPLHGIRMDECTVCTTVVDYLDKLLEEDDVDKEITAIIEKVCTVVPASFRDKCTNVLEVYGPYILQMIGQMADSRQVCQDIDLCPTPPGHVHLLGGHKCTFGPSYWCKTDAHAAACKAQSYCKGKMMN